VLSALLDEFENSMGEIPEDGTVDIDFEDAISELIEWVKLIIRNRLIIVKKKEASYKPLFRFYL
jgi:hypothetical protein